MNQFCRQRDIRLAICGVGAYMPSPLESAKLLHEYFEIEDITLVGELNHPIDKVDVLKDHEPFIVQNDIPIWELKPLNRRERRRLKFKKK